MTEAFKIPEPTPIKIGDRDFTFHFNMYALNVLSDLLGANQLTCHERLIEVTKKDINEGIALLMYSGIVGYEKSKGNFNHGIEISLIAGYMATLTNIDEFNKVWEIYKDSSGMSSFIQEATVQDKKKVRSHGKK